MIEPRKRIGYLTEINGKQVTVIKRILGKALKAKSAQISKKSQYPATFYEWDMYVAFSFDCEGYHCCPKVGEGLELVEHANLPNSLGKEYRFRWKDENGTVWRSLEHEKDNVVKVLCYDERGEFFLKDKSEITGFSCLYKIVDV